MYEFVSMSKGAHRGQQRVPEPPELESQVVVVPPDRDES